MIDQPSYHKRFAYSLQNLLPTLLSDGLITAEQIRLCNARAHEMDINPASDQGLDFLLNLGLRSQNRKDGFRLTEENILRAIARQKGLEFKRVDPLELDLEVSTKTISESFARTNMIVPLRIEDGKLEIIAFNPFSPELWEDMDRVSHLPCRVFLGTRAEINRLIDDFYQFRIAVQSAEQEFQSSNELGNLEGRVTVHRKTDPTSQKHIIKAVNYLLRSALRERASDIHLEPKRSYSHVRFRIDGVLHTIHKLPLTIHQAMLNRLKGISRMDISEKRRPQDGRVQLMLDKVPTDVRVSTIPVAFGEKIVLRLLSSNTTLMPLDGLGMTAPQQELYKNFLNNTYGLILVTGPTGSGKSTTLYSTLKALASPRINLVTLEDPIEMVLDEFNQVGIQSKIGVTFSQMLRHILRQDPDIIMIGEMRDLETSQQAIQAALTGHLVFSTLHTNDAIAAITRLIDLGIPPYLLNASLIGTIAQRLVRRICPHCKAGHKPDKELFLKWPSISRNLDQGETFYKGSGCDHCRHTGFHGREGIFEIVPFDLDIKEGVRKNCELSELHALARSKKIPTLFESGMDKVRKGITTLDEVIRVAAGSSDQT